jgi:hypothetical protein
MWNYENNKPILHQIILTTIAAYYGQNPDDHTRLSRGRQKKIFALFIY